MNITKETYYRHFRKNGSQIRVWRESKYESDSYIGDVEDRIFALEEKEVPDSKMAQELILLEGVNAVQIGTEQKGTILYKDWP